MSHHLRLGLIPAYLLLCLLFGGASAAGYWANTVLQLLAIPIILWALIARRSTPVPRAARQLIGIAVLIFVVGAVQLIPLPPGIWTSLSGRAPIAEGFRLLGQPLPWMPISLAPYKTTASLLWLLPAVAVLLGIVKLGAFKAKWMAWTVVLLTVLSVAIGALQIAGGDNSPWYFYAITNRGVTTGFFSNANHMATLLVVTVPFLAALHLSASRRAHSAQAKSGMLVILAGTLMVVLVGVAINQSLAGIGLMVPAIAASLLMIWSRKRALPGWSALVLAALALASVWLVFNTPFADNFIAAESQASPYSRNTSFAISAGILKDFFPIGSGVGTFADVYRSYENPAGVTRWFMNHVHGDYIEIVLETGILGAVVLLLFLLWWAARTFAIWRSPDPDYYARAATIATAAILAHSVVDYPLRTAAISALFAACCALMADPRAKVRKKAEQPGQERAKHLAAD